MEEIGEKMHPHFELIREAIDKNQVKELKSDQLVQISDEFSQGIAEYEQLFTKVKQMKAPAKVIGVHKKLEHAFGSYVVGCQEMNASLVPENTTVDAALFNQSEEKQDDATDVISFCIQKMTAILLK